MEMRRREQIMKVLSWCVGADKGIYLTEEDSALCTAMAISILGLGCNASDTNVVVRIT